MFQSILGHTEDAFSETLNHFYILSAHIIPTAEDRARGVSNNICLSPVTSLSLYLLSFSMVYSLLMQLRIVESYFIRIYYKLLIIILSIQIKAETDELITSQQVTFL